MTERDFKEEILALLATRGGVTRDEIYAALNAVGVKVDRALQSLNTFGAVERAFDDREWRYWRTGEKPANWRPARAPGPARPVVPAEPDVAAPPADAVHRAVAPDEPAELGPVPGPTSAPFACSDCGAVHKGVGMRAVPEGRALLCRACQQKRQPVPTAACSDCGEAKRGVAIRSTEPPCDVPLCLACYRERNRATTPAGEPAAEPGTPAATVEERAQREELAAEIRTIGGGEISNPTAFFQVAIKRIASSAERDPDATPLIPPAAIDRALEAATPDSKLGRALARFRDAEDAMLAAARDLADTVAEVMARAR